MGVGEGVECGCGGGEEWGWPGECGEQGKAAGAHGWCAGSGDSMVVGQSVPVRVWRVGVRQVSGEMGYVG